MRITLLRATVLAASAVALSGCSGNSNSPGSDSDPVVPVVDTTFSTFVKSLLATNAPDTATPVDVNARELTFDESATAYNAVLGN